MYSRIHRTGYIAKLFEPPSSSFEETPGSMELPLFVDRRRDFGQPLSNPCPALFLDSRVAQQLCDPKGVESVLFGRMLKRSCERGLELSQTVSGAGPEHARQDNGSLPAFAAISEPGID